MLTRNENQMEEKMKKEEISLKGQEILFLNIGNATIRTEDIILCRKRKKEDATVIPASILIKDAINITLKNKTKMFIEFDDVDKFNREACLLLGFKPEKGQPDYIKYPILTDIDFINIGDTRIKKEYIAVLHFSKTERSITVHFLNGEQEDIFFRMDSEKSFKSTRKKIIEKLSRCPNFTCLKNTVINIEQISGYMHDDENDEIYISLKNGNHCTVKD